MRENYALEALSFPSLRYVYSLEFYESDALVLFRAHQLKEMKNFYVVAMDELSALVLHESASADSVTLSLNQNLTNCCPLLSMLQEAGYVRVEDNGMGCRSLPEIEQSCRLDLAEVPTLNDWGQLITVLTMLGLGLAALRLRKAYRTDR